MPRHHRIQPSLALTVLIILIVLIVAGLIASPLRTLKMQSTHAGGAQTAINGFPRRLIIPVKGVKASEIQDTFNQPRGTGRHEATDILAPRGTPVIAADDGTVKKLFLSKPGGITIYQFDPSEQYCYYYAHLERYADDIHEGTAVKQGQVVGYVGTTGDAPANTPHLHFAIFKLGPEKHWWQGTPINPYPVLIQ